MRPTFSIIFFTVLSGAGYGLLFLLGMAGLGVTIWPYVVPDALTIWDAAAPERSQVFMLVGVVLILPLILGYTAWSYWVFRGKVGAEGYH